MPVEWTTDDQKKFLVQEKALYKRIGGRHYTKHWPELYQKWFQLWPERPCALPGVPESAVLTPDQTKLLANAISQRKDQLRRWMQWHSGAGEKRSANSKTTRILNGLLKPKTRTKKSWEVYSKRYYSTRIQPHITKGMTITEVNNKIQEVFASESPEIKAEVEKLCSEEHEEKKRKKKVKSEIQSDGTESDVETSDNEVEFDAVTIRTNIQQCGPALQRVLEHFSRQTGWSFTVLMGGPDPLDPEGENTITSLHAGGKTKDGFDFADVYPKFDSEVVEAYGEFLDRVFKFRESMPEDSKDDSDQEMREVGDDDGNQDDHEQDDGNDMSEENLNLKDAEPGDKETSTPDIYTPPPTSHLASPTADHLAKATTTDAAATTTPVTDLAIHTGDAHSQSPRYTTNSLATSLHAHSSTSASASIATPSGPSPSLATSLDGYYPPVAPFGPDGPQAPGSFTDLLNSDDMFPMFNSWDNPFLAGVGPGMPHSGMDSAFNPSAPFGLAAQKAMPWNHNYNIPQPFLPLGYGGFPSESSGFSSNTFGGSTGGPGSMNGCAASQNQSSFNGTGTVPSTLQSLSVHHAPSLPTLPMPQALSQSFGTLQPAATPPPSISENSQPSVPLSDITAIVQPTPELPPTQPGVVNRAENNTDRHSNVDTSPGRSKRKLVPSLRAQRDNAIGKENHVPPPGSVPQERTKNKVKKNSRQVARKGAGDHRSAGNSGANEPALTATPTRKKRKVA